MRLHHFVIYSNSGNKLSDVVFALSFTVAVLSHFARCLSRGFLTNFSCPLKFVFLTFTSTQGTIMKSDMSQKNVRKNPFINFYFFWENVYPGGATLTWHKYYRSTQTGAPTFADDCLFYSSGIVACT